MEQEDDRKPSPRASPDDGHASSGPDTPSKKVKPALKKEHNHHHDKEKKHLKWDEEVIEEHDQLRGTRMKIDEPNTPYTHYDSGAESDDSRRPKSPASQKATLSWDVLETKLNSVAAVREAYPSSPSSHADHSTGAAEAAEGGEATCGAPATEEDQKRDEMRKLEFKEHRKRHYNEMELVRQFRKEHPDGLLEDDNGDNDADNEGED